MITGEAGVEHVTSANAGALNAMEIGTGKYVFNLDNKFEYNLQSNNLIRIYKGQGIMNGRHFEMSPDQYQDLEISNGTQNEFRKDLVVIRYTKNLDTGIETGALVVIEGESVSQDPVDPEYNDGNILEGESVVDFPLYRINISGLNVTGVDKLFEVFAGYKAEIDSINTSLLQKLQDNIQLRKNPDDESKGQYTFNGVDWVNFSSGDSAELLWTNPNPDSDFPSQLVSINLEKYDIVLIEFTYQNDNVTGKAYAYAPIDGKYYSAKCILYNNSLAYWTARNFMANNTGVSFTIGINYNASNSDRYCIPLKIYGCKNLFGES